MPHNYQLEICANSVTSALAAQAGGADRIEFCQNLETGGTTPSHGQISTTRQHVDIGIHVLIRPRGGDFLYSDLEYEEMKADIRFCKASGCEGVVIGLLHDDGRIDIQRTAELVALAAPMHVTFHRAFDRCAEPFQALEDIIGCGCGRLLTSGLRNTAEEGISLIKELVVRAQGRIEIMPGSGINALNIQQLARETGALAFHTSAKVIARSKMEFANDDVKGMGDEYWVTSTQKVREIADLLNKL